MITCNYCGKEIPKNAWVVVAADVKDGVLTTFTFCSQKCHLALLREWAKQGYPRTFYRREDVWYCVEVTKKTVYIDGVKVMEVKENEQTA
jgi:ribosomal protein L24E